MNEILRSNFRSHAAQFCLVAGICFFLGRMAAGTSFLSIVVDVAMMGLFVLTLILSPIAEEACNRASSPRSMGKYMFAAIEILALGCAAFAWGGLSWLQIPAGVFCLSGVAIVNHKRLTTPLSQMGPAGLPLKISACGATTLGVAVLMLIQSGDGRGGAGLLFAATVLFAGIWISMIRMSVSPPASKVCADISGAQSGGWAVADPALRGTLAHHAQKRKWWRSWGVMLGLIGAILGIAAYLTAFILLLFLTFYPEVLNGTEYLPLAYIAILLPGPPMYILDIVGALTKIALPPAMALIVAIAMDRSRRPAVSQPTASGGSDNSLPAATSDSAPPDIPPTERQ
ncbi:MAG: hypothetical protein ACP5O1_06780 [Phycisphaerae bacterium]